MAYIGRENDGFGVRSRFIYTATGGQTTFNTDDSGNALSYSDGAYVDVYLNGVLLDPADYTATSLTSIVLDSGATASDILEVIVYDVFSVFSGTFTNGITASDATVTGTILAGTDSGDAFNDHSKLRVQKADHAYLQIKSANTKQAGVLLGDTDDDFVGGMIYDNSTNHLQFNSNDAERMRIDSSGQVGIGTTSPVRRFHVHESGSGTNGYIHLTNANTGATTTDGFSILNSGANGRVTLMQRENESMIFSTNATERMRLLSGGGLTFNGDTATANALNDYEEGTWTPTIAGMTYEFAGGAYTKIGRRVHCSGFIINCTSGTASSVTAKLSGLPFTVSNTLGTTSLEDGGAFTYFNYLGRSSSFISVAPDDSSTECFLYFTVGASTGYTSVLRTDLDNSSFSARFFFTYIST
tara:strand:+ start:1260 stop:2495 length:1236 start_codon:yes stop_codon:yes gene_type:complete